MPFAVLERYEEALETIAERARRAASALEKYSVPYAVIGGNAVASWVASVDPEAVRGTRDVDIDRPTPVPGSSHGDEGCRQRCHAGTALEQRQRYAAEQHRIGIQHEVV